MRMPGRVKARPAARFVPAPGRAGRAAKRGASRPPTPRRVQERPAPPREPLASRNWRVLRQQVLHLGLQQVAHRQAEGERSPTVGLLERAEPRPSRVVRLQAIRRLAFPLVDQVEEIAIARLEPDEIRVEVRQVIEEPAEEVGKVLPPDDEGLAVEAERELVEFAIEEPFGEGGRHMDEPAPSDARHLPQEAARIIGMLQHPDDPCGFLREMSRVGRRGLVHVPTTFTERLFYREFHKFTFGLDGKTLVIRRKNFPDLFGGLFDYLAHFDADFIRFKARNRDLFNLVYEWEGEASYRLEAYDPARPRFGSFEKTYRGRPFPFRLAVSDLLQAQVENLLAKDPPVSRRQRLSRWGRALLNTAWRRRP